MRKPKSEVPNKLPKQSKIVSWKPKDEDILTTYDGGIFIFRFDKLFKDEEAQNYMKFTIKKGSYDKQLDVITRYINFYIKFYDQEHELPVSFLKIKYGIDKQKRFNAENYNQLIDLIYEIIFTDTTINKICQLVEDNYLDDIESSEDSKRYISKEKKHLESLEFTNKHVKILLRISFGMKIIAPILFHFVFVNKIKLDKDSDLIYQFYKRLFDIFSDDCNMYNKLFVYTKAKVLESKSHNSLIFDQRDIMGGDEYITISQFLKKVLISENIVKYKFNEHWDPKTHKYKENIIGFNKTILKYQLMYFLKDQYPKNLIEVTSAKNADGLSGMDKMEMNLQKIDEGLIILAEMNVETEIERIRRDYDYGITEEEIDYYAKHMVISPLQAQLVFHFWGKNFGAYRNTNNIGRRDYIFLALTLKRILLMSAGIDDSGKFNDSTILPYILTGNLQDKINTRIIRNNKYVSKVESSYLYQEIEKNKYSNLVKIREEYILSLLSQINNTTFTYVVYEDQDLLGQPIEYNEDKLSDEMLFLIHMI